MQIRTGALNPHLQVLLPVGGTDFSFFAFYDPQVFGAR